MRFRCILMRHGQASFSHEKGDFSRTLTPLGHRQVRATAEAIHALGWRPQHALCSKAARTLETMREVASVWTPSLDWSAEVSLYLGDLRHISLAIRLVESELEDCVLVVGHNPGWSLAIAELTGTHVQLDVAEAGLLSVEADSWGEALELQGLWKLESVIRGGRAV